MKRNEKLLEAIGFIDEKHLPEPREVFNINDNDGGQEAEMQLSSAYRRRFPVKAVALAASAIAAAAAFVIVSKKFPLPAGDPVDPAYTLNTAIESSVTQPSDKGESFPLDLIGYYINEEGQYTINYYDWKKSDNFDLFRKYFFGSWDNAGGIFGKEDMLLVIDDSEKSLIMNDAWRFTGFYELGENVLALVVNSNAETLFFWLDINSPDIMYADMGNGSRLFFYGELIDYKPTVLTKTGAPANQPEENFLSIYKLYEISRDYGIDFNMLVDIEYYANIYIGNDPYFITENGWLWAKLLHDDWYQFYPVYLVSEAPDKLEFKTRIGNIMYDNSELDAEYTVEKNGAEWKRTVRVTLRDGSVVTLNDNDTELSEESRLSALELLDFYVDEEGHYQAGYEQWTSSDNYDLFRRYFFGTWSAWYSYYGDDSGEKVEMEYIIDDSERADIVTDPNIWYSGTFFEAKDNVLVFINGAVDGPTMYWINTDNPDTLYSVRGGIGEHNWLWSKDGGYPDVFKLTKTDKPINEPTDGFLSVYRIYEMSRDYGIDIEMLTDIEYSEAIGFIHDAYANSYPVYLVSESPDKIVLKTILWNYYELPEKAIDAMCTFEKIDGRWKRTVELNLNDGSFVTLSESESGLSLNPVFNKLT